MRCIVRSLLAVTVLLTILPDSASAQTSRTIKIIVPSTPGGGSDTIAQILADYVSRAYNQSMVVENRPGASNTIATEAVARAAPDGNTLIITTPVRHQSQLRKLNYDPLTSFEPICHLVRSPQLIVVHAASPYRTLTDLVDAARAKPGELTMAVRPGLGRTSPSRRSSARRLNINFIPFQGTARP